MRKVRSDCVRFRVCGKSKSWCKYHWRECEQKTRLSLLVCPMYKYFPVVCSEELIDRYRRLFMKRKINMKHISRFLLFIKCGSLRGAMTTIAKYEGVSLEAVSFSIRRCMKTISEIQMIKYMVTW